MIRRIREFFEPVSDMIEGLRLGWSFRFVLANFVMNGELQQTVAFARIDINRALECCEIRPDFIRKKLESSAKDLGDLFHV